MRRRSSSNSAVCCDVAADDRAVVIEPDFGRDLRRLPRDDGLRDELDHRPGRGVILTDAERVRQVEGRHGREGVQLAEELVDLHGGHLDRPFVRQRDDQRVVSIVPERVRRRHVR
jgi:hypothetical protein